MLGKFKITLMLLALVYYSNKIYNFVEIGFKAYVMPKSKWRYYKKNGKSYEWTWTLVLKFEFALQFEGKTV